ncbi:Nif3-like dinuclear metal center hexameric protein [Halobacteriales archaeon QS_3_64_16]|nr:MAG: Nif3-like dinuclear metal center hexameric protein [Halobacteriales archaeon QS_3_64_16]
MDLADLRTRFDERLRTAAFADLDASANGLQVGPEEREITHVAVAVDAAVETIERAADADADLLVTHHGVIWGGLDRVTGREYRRITPLFENDLALYVSHLPLDAHPSLGNAAGLADLLSLDDREPFGALGPEHLGTRGFARDPFSPADLATLLDRELATGARGVQALDFGSEEIEEIAILTGSGADWFEEAVESGVDAFVTGEGKGKIYHEAKEAGTHVFLAGHYATETFGVRSLGGLAEEWGLETTFVERPTGL